MKQAIRNFINDEDGLAVLEYIIGAALLVAGLTIVFTGYGADLQTKLGEILAAVNPTP